MRKKSRRKRGSEPRIFRSRGGRLNHRANEAVKPEGKSSPQITSWICNFYLSVAADPSLRYTRMSLGRSATNQQTNQPQIKTIDYTTSSIHTPHTPRSIQPLSINTSRPPPPATPPSSLAHPPPSSSSSVAVRQAIAELIQLAKWKGKTYSRGNPSDSHWTFSAQTCVSQGLAKRGFHKGG